MDIVHWRTIDCSEENLDWDTLKKTFYITADHGIDNLNIEISPFPGTTVYIYRNEVTEFMDVYPWAKSYFRHIEESFAKVEKSIQDYDIRGRASRE